MDRQARPRLAATVVAAIAAIAIAAVLVSGCASDDDGEARASTTQRSTTTAGGSTSSNGATSTTAELSGDGVRLVDLRLDLTDPIDVTYRPGSTSLLVAERGGAIREAVADGDGFRLADRPVIDLTERVGSTDGERGLLGIAVSPDGSHLYASYTESGHGDSRIDEYPLSGSDGSLRADPDGRRQLVAITQPFSNHNGGSLRFGPDGMLYAGFGDGGAANDPYGNGQATDTLLGKILRLDPTGKDDSDDDGVPDDNPFVTPRTDDRTPMGHSGLPEIWLTGVRNPWRFDFDPATGDLWIGDVGQDRFEEIDHLTPDGATPAGFGANLGWDLYEGDAKFDDADPADGGASDGPFTAPLLTYPHDEGCSITGGVVVRDPKLPGLDGAFLYGDFCQAGIRAVRIAADGSLQRTELSTDLGSVVSFARGPGGAVYVVSLDDGVQRLSAT